MDNSLPKEKPSKIFGKIIWNSTVASLIGGTLAFFVLSASPENALKFGAHGGRTLSEGMGLVGFVGSIIWNFVVSVFGALCFGFATAIASLIYYSIIAGRQKDQPARYDP